MDFELIDKVQADDLNKGDIVSVVNVEREYLQITGHVDDDNTGVLVYPAHNLSTGEDEDVFIADWNDFIDIYRSY